MAHGDPPQPTFDLNNWKLTLPVDDAGVKAGKASEVSAQALVAGYQDDYFFLNEQGQLVFWCPVDGAVTEGTEYPRTELREMLDTRDPSINWTSAGTHLLDAECRVLALPSSEKVIIGQIHSYSGKAKPLIKLQYYKNRLEALVKTSPLDGRDQKLTFDSLPLESEIRYQIKLQGDSLTLTVNGRSQSVNILENSSAWAGQTFYFKAGCYVQDNLGSPSEGGRVVFSKLAVTHY
jgi:hypothetical protein